MAIATTNTPRSVVLGRDSYRSSYLTAMERGFRDPKVKPLLDAIMRRQHMNGSNGKPEPLRILDFGCGDWDYAKHLAAFFQGENGTLDLEATMVGIDRRKMKFERSKAREWAINFPRIRFVPLERIEVLDASGLMELISRGGILKFDIITTFNFLPTRESDMAKDILTLNVGGEPHVKFLATVAFRRLREALAPHGLFFVSMAGDTYFEPELFEKTCWRVLLNTPNDSRLAFDGFNTNILVAMHN